MSTPSASVNAERVIIHLTTQIAQLSRDLAIAQAQLDAHQEQAEQKSSATDA